MEKDFKIAAIMTAPRYENTYARNYIERALRELGIPLTVSGGVFYGQCMQMMLEQLVKADGIDYAVTIDFDSLFTAKQLQRLISIIAQDDKIDAITGLQVRRGKYAMLGTVDGGEMIDGNRKQVVWDGNPIKAKTAHFGLTVIDIRKLADVQKPWFVSEPDENGEWTENKTDDDVWFWRQWEKAGNSIYFDPGVRIGHLEEMVAIHNEHCEPIHVYPSEWELMSYGSRAD